MNRAYGVTFGILSSTLFLLLFWIIKDLKSKKTKELLILSNGITLFFALGNLTVYSARVDPDIQFKDFQTLYISKQEPNEKIVNQYYVNWKTLEKQYENNHVIDYGVFRIYKSYRIDTLNLNMTK